MMKGAESKMNRRSFLQSVGKGLVGLAVGGVVGCDEKPKEQGESYLSVSKKIPYDHNFKISQI